MEERIRYGMVGGGTGGFIGEVHRQAVLLDPRAALVAGCFSRSLEKNRATARACGLDLDRCYPDFRVMAEREAARPDGIDFVSITTSNDTHYEIAKCFLNKGIHVVCEKPLCLTVREAGELCRLAREKNLLFAVTHTYTGYVMSKVMREMIREGKIGNILSVNAEYAQEWLLDALEDEGPIHPGAWKTDPRFAGSSNCVADIGTHIENYVHFATGLKIKRLLATANRFGHALEFNANILVEYENGANGAYWCSQVACGRMNGLCVRIYGDKGALAWEQERPEILCYTPRGEPARLLLRGAGYLDGPAASLIRLPAGHPEGLIIAFANIYRSFISALLARRRGEEPGPAEYPTVEDGLEGVRFVQAVVESARRDSAWVNLD